MSNVAKLKKEAADLEQKKQFDKAVKVYVKLFAEFDKHPQEVDVALFNRAGDIQVKLGQVAEGVDTYEKAVDFYADGGFFNNAIAMCNKILRQAPGRASVYYKLGKISAQKGFKAEARQNFVEYADRMEKAGNTAEAFRALMEFMDLVPDQDDIRSMLADQLIKANRKPDAVAQLQKLYERHTSEGRLAEAEAAADRVRALDPTVELIAATESHESSGGDLVFLDLNAPTPPKAELAPPPPRPAPKPAAPAPPPPVAVAPPPPPAPAAAQPPAQEMEITRASDGGSDLSVSPPAGGLEIEPTSFGEISLDNVAPAPAPAPTPPKPAAPVQPSAPRPFREIAPPTEEEMSLADLSFSVPGSEPKRESEPEPEAEFMDFGSAELPPSAIAPVIDDSAATPSDGVSMDFLDIEPVEPEPAPPPPPPKAAKAPAPVPPKPAPAPPPKAAARPAPSAMPELDLSDVVPEGPSRKSTVFAAKAVNILAAAVQEAPEDWSLRRELAEAMLEAGDRAGGVRELEVAMSGAENSDDLELAMALAEVLGKLEPLVVKHHQKRVEYAFRRNDRPRLVEAYLTLADALMQNAQTEKARAVYQRVLELSPDNMQAQAAVETIAPPAPATPPVAATRGSMAAKRPSAAAKTPPKAPPKAEPVSDEGFVNLGDWLRDDEGPKDTRMVVDEKEPTGDEEADFADMLKKFKQGVAENVDAEDYQSHYDLAIAFREMGLLDEAIAGFQRALGSKTNRLPTYEALGECFIEKGQAKMAGAILGRGLSEGNATDDQLVGVLYLLGRAAEEQGQTAQALEYYQRVFVIDIQFRDVADRMSSLEKATR